MYDFNGLITSVLPLAYLSTSPAVALAAPFNEYCSVNLPILFSMVNKTSWFVAYLATFCSTVFIRVERAARRSKPRGASRRRSLRTRNRRLGNIAGSKSLWQREITLSKGALLGSYHQVTTMWTASRLRAVHH